MSILSRFAINIMSKHWYHVLISLKLCQYSYVDRRNVYYLSVQMMHLVAPVEDISHHFCWRCIDNSGGDNVCHVSMITVFRYLKRRIGEEPANSGKMNVAPISRISKSGRNECYDCTQVL